VPLKDAELSLARQLIEQGAVDEFRPENFRDTVRERVLEQIQRKVDGQEISASPSEAPQTKVIDLMEALKASLTKRGASTEEKKPARQAVPKAAKEPAAKPRKKASGAR
jgi:DNA end-binding protein Ku